VNRSWPAPRPSSPASSSPLRVPETRQAWSTPTRVEQPAGAPATVPAATRDVEVSRPVEDPGPSLPTPRADVATAPEADSRATPKGRALRRRVPQSHLAPELRQPVPSGVADGVPVAPMSADAASALSRYQASRQAAQSVVDAGPIDERGRP
jgi:hypothetical protein